MRKSLPRPSIMAQSAITCPDYFAIHETPGPKIETQGPKIVTQGPKIETPGPKIETNGSQN